MKIECIKEKLETQLTEPIGFLKNTTLPALSGILLEAKILELKIFSTNLDLGIGNFKVQAKVLKKEKF